MIDKAVSFTNLVVPPLAVATVFQVVALALLAAALVAQAVALGPDWVPATVLGLVQDSATGPEMGQDSVPGKALVKDPEVAADKDHPQDKLLPPLYTPAIRYFDKSRAKTSPSTDVAP